MHLRRALNIDADWIYDVLDELRQPVHYSKEDFRIYFEETIHSNFFSFLIFCDDEKKIGLVSLNKFYMPRYLGFGYEMEELVIHKDFRGKGLSYKMIEAVKEWVSSDKQVRKLLIKTNGEDSMHIYAKALNETDLKTYQVYLNKL